MILRTGSDPLSSNGSVLRNQTLLGPLTSSNISNNAVINTVRDFNSLKGLDGDIVVHGSQLQAPA